MGDFIPEIRYPTENKIEEQNMDTAILLY